LRLAGTTPAAAIREFVLDSVEGIRRIPAAQWRGELGFLAAISPAVHRLALEMADRQASAFATAIAEMEPVPPAIAKPQGIALASVFQIILTEAGRRTREGQTQTQIADEWRPAIEAVLNDLDRWLTPGTDQDASGRELARTSKSAQAESLPAPTRYPSQLGGSMRAASYEG
jgi:hypothetical protein